MDVSKLSGCGCKGLFVLICNLFLGVVLMFLIPYPLVWISPNIGILLGMIYFSPLGLIIWFSVTYLLWRIEKNYFGHPSKSKNTNNL